MDLKDFERRFLKVFGERVDDAPSFTVARNSSDILLITKPAPSEAFGYLGILVPDAGTVAIGCEITETSFYAWTYEQDRKDPVQGMIDEALELVNHILRGEVYAKVVHHKSGSPALSGFYKADEAPLGRASAVLDKHFGGESAVTEYAWAGLTKH